MKTNLHLRNQKAGCVGIKLFLIGLIFALASCAPGYSDVACDNRANPNTRGEANLFFEKWFRATNIMKWSAPIEFSVSIQGDDSSERTSQKKEVIRASIDELNDILPIKVSFSGQVYSGNFVLQVGESDNHALWADHQRRLQQWSRRVRGTENATTRNLSAMGGAVKIALTIDDESGRIVSGYCAIVDRGRFDSVAIDLLNYASKSCIFGAMLIGEPSFHSDQEAQLALSILYDGRVGLGKNLGDEKAVILNLIERRLCAK